MKKSYIRNSSDMYERWFGGLSSGRSYAAAKAYVKAFPRAIVIVPNLAHLDLLVSLGIVPSRIRLGSELRSSGSIDFLSIDGVEVEVEKADGLRS